MPNITAAAIAAPEHLSLFVRGAVILIVIFSVYNYLRALYFGRVISRIAALGATSRDSAKSARELDCAGVLGKFWLRRKSALRKLVLTSEEEERPSAETDSVRSPAGAESAGGEMSEHESKHGSKHGSEDGSEDGSEHEPKRGSKHGSEHEPDDTFRGKTGSVDEELSEEAEEELLKQADRVRPQAPFDKARFYIPESRLEGAKIRWCDSRFDRKGSPVTLVIGCVLLLVLGELFIRNYEVIVTFLFGVLDGN